HGIQPLFRQARRHRLECVVSHALLAVTIGTRRRSTDTPHARDATTKTDHQHPNPLRVSPASPIVTPVSTQPQPPRLLPRLLHPRSLSQPAHVGATSTPHAIAVPMRTVAMAAGSG